MNQNKRTNSLRKRVPKEKKPSNSAFLLQGKIFFLTYKGISENGQKLTKNTLFQYLLNLNPFERKFGPEKYLICEEKYDSGQPHFHVILGYSVRKRILRPDFYNIMGIHPNIQPVRNMKAALEYVHKEDTDPLTNMDIIRQKLIAKAKDTSSLYQLLQEEMLKDPLRFNLSKYLHENNLFKQIYKASYSKAISLLKIAHPAAARAVLRNKPGIKFITHDLILQKLNPQQLKQFYSHPCYQKIIDHINQIYLYPNLDQSSMAPSKTPHLLIVGNSSIGKSALVDHRPTAEYPYPGLMHYYACYHLSIGQKYFPQYVSFDYRLVRWNEFTIDSDLFPKKGYNRLLDYLEGAPSALPQKGRPPVERLDNPKHILTSNRTLEEHIHNTFRSNESRNLAKSNLGTRVDCVVIPKGKDIHFLRKLFVSN